MKLLLRTSLYYIIISFVVFSIGSLIIYNIFLKEIRKETDLYLIERYHTILNIIESDNVPSTLEGFKLDIDTLTYKPEKVGRESIVFKDTMVMHQYLKRLENNRKLTVIANVDGEYYKFTLFDVIVETDDIMDGVFNGLWRLFLFLGSVMVISSFLISRTIFKPFNKTLEQIRNFNIKNLQPLKLKKSKISEFNQLNMFIEKMTEKINQDYINLKEFSENASHEMQTPIAIAKGKLELMLQSNDLSQDHMDHIESAYKSMDHMSKLSYSLTLLSKIENREFSDFKEHNFSDLIKKALNDFNELLHLKEIKLTSDIQDNVKIHNNYDLLRILINNLLNNALRHNIAGGKINIGLKDHEFIISNTGDPLINEPELLFDRFKKDKQSDKSLGLGLAIVKKITDISGYTIRYEYIEDRHNITLHF